MKQVTGDVVPLSYHECGLIRMVVSNTHGVSQREGPQAAISLVCRNQAGIDDAHSLFPYLWESRKLCSEKFSTFI